MTGSFALALDSTAADPGRVVAGLPLALRLALDAQQGGAECIVVPSDASAIRTTLRDERLRIPVLERVPDGARVLRVPANFVVCRDGVVVRTVLGREASDRPNEQTMERGRVNLVERE